MGSIGPAEILVVLVAALIILGPKRLPEAARQLGRALAEFRRVSSDLQAEVRDAFADTTSPPHGDPLTPTSPAYGEAENESAEAGSGSAGPAAAPNSSLERSESETDKLG